MEIQSDTFAVECSDSCKNSPKKELLKDLTIAFTNNEIDFCVDIMRDDIVWEIVGNKRIVGKADFHKTLLQNKYDHVQKLQIDNIITHGNVGSVNGTIFYKNNESIAFCHVYRFAGFGKNAKIKQMTSYVIQHMNENY